MEGTKNVGHQRDLNSETSKNSPECGDSKNDGHVRKPDQKAKSVLEKGMYCNFL